MEAQPNSSAVVESPQVPVVSSRPGCLTYLFFVATLGWIVTVTAGIHVAGWFTEQVLLIEGIPLPWFVWPLISWGHGILLALPVVPLAIWTRAPRFRATYQTWAMAIAFIMVLGLARVFPMTQTLPAALAQIVLSVVCVGVVLIWTWMRGHRLSVRLDVFAPALALAPIMVAPSLLWGSLGSPLDTVLNLLAGLTLGLFAGVILSVFLFGPISEHSRDFAARHATLPRARRASGPGWDMAFGGLAAGVALVILGGGFGFGGSQLLLLISLPLLGLVAGGAVRWAEPAVAERAWLPIAALVGLAAAAPLMFVDPDELTLLLEGREIMAWALQAAGVSLVLSLVVGLALWIFCKRINGAPRPALSLGGVTVTWIAGVLLYFFAGQPGFYGEQLFVILRDQADLRPAYTMPDRNERLRYVYTTLTRHADTTQASLRAVLDRGHIAYRPYYLVNGMEVNGGPLSRAYLSRQPQVDRILDSPHLRPLPEPVPVSIGHDPAPTEPQWNITSIGADRVWKEFGVTGQGIVVGQSDSGVQGDHPALRDGYRGRDGQNDTNWLDPWNHTRAPSDINGHGTHTLGSIVGQGGIGVAPGAEWFGCVNLARNIGNPAWYLNCMQFMLAPYPQNGDPLKDGDPTKAAHVINDSWGCPPLEGCDAKSLEPAVAALRAAGIFVVASAGNEGMGLEGPRCGSVSDPIAIYGEVFSVGAVDRFGEVAYFSSRGPVTVDGSGRVKPDILAPGVDVMSSLPGNRYGSNSGTSMAGPHVVGVVALMWSAQPKLIGNIDRTQQILEQTAQPYTGTQDPCSTGGTPNNTSGYGLVDAYAAVKAALAEK